MAANKQTGDSSAKKTKSPFISFCMTTVVCLLIVAVTFAVIMFKTDTIFSADVTDSTFRIATRNNTTTYSTTTTQIQKDVSLPDIPDSLLAGVTGSTDSEDDQDDQDNQDSQGNNQTTPGGNTGGGGDTQYTPGSDLEQGLKQSALNFYNKCTEPKGNPVIDLGGGLYLYDGLPWDNTNAWLLDEDKCNKYVNEYVGMDLTRSLAIDGNCSSTPLQGTDGVMCADTAAPSILAFLDIDEAGCVPNWGVSTRPKQYCAILENTEGGKFYLPCTCVGDAKGHTWPGGIAQTFLSLNGHSVNNWNFNTDGGTIAGPFLGGPVTTVEAIRDGYASVTYCGGKVFPQMNLELNSAIKNKLSGYKMVGYISWK